MGNQLSSMRLNGIGSTSSHIFSSTGRISRSEINGGTLCYIMSLRGITMLSPECCWLLGIKRIQLIKRLGWPWRMTVKRLDCKKLCVKIIPLPFEYCSMLVLESLPNIIATASSSKTAPELMSFRILSERDSAIIEKKLLVTWITAPAKMVHQSFMTQSDVAASILRSICWITVPTQRL